MGFKPIDHKFGAILFGVLFAIGGVAFVTESRPEYIMAYIGSFLWVLGKFSYEKNIVDKKNQAFDYPRYLDAEWDNLAVNLVGIYLVVPQMHNIAGLQTEVEFTDLWYCAAGIITDGIYILVVWVAKIKKKYEGSPLPELPKNEEAGNP